MHPFYYGNYPPPAGPNPQTGVPFTVPYVCHFSGPPAPPAGPHGPGGHTHHATLGGPLLPYPYGPYNNFGQPVPHYPPGWTGYIPPNSTLPQVPFVPPPQPITTINEFFGLPPYAQNPELPPQAPYPNPAAGHNHNHHHHPHHHPAGYQPPGAPHHQHSASAESDSEAATESASSASLASVNNNESMTNEAAEDANNQQLEPVAAATVATTLPRAGEAPLEAISEDEDGVDYTARLPDPLILKILRFLSPSDLASLGACHPRFDDVCRDRTLWNQQLNIYETTLVTEIMDVLGFGGDKLLYIVIYNYMAVNSVLNFIADRCPNVERITILSEQSADLGNETIAYLQSRLSKLREITLWGVNVHPDHIKQMLSYSRVPLQELTIYYHPGMRYYADPMQVPLSLSGLSFHPMTHVDLTGLDLRTADLTLLLRTSRNMRGFLWSAQTSTQILAVFQALPPTLTTIGIDIMFGTFDEEVPEIGVLLTSVRANLRIEEFRASAPDHEQFVTLCRQVFGGVTEWPQLRTVAYMKRGHWTQNELTNFGSFPEKITKLVMHCDVPDQIASLLIENMHGLEFLHIEVDLANRGGFIQKIVAENRLPNLKYLFVSRQLDNEAITQALKELTALRPKLRVIFTTSPGVGKDIFFSHPPHRDAEVERWAMFHRCVGEPKDPEHVMLMR